ncbi:hypothetical protein NDU88_006432 [Pleurodeles waltl]|uniref:Uncharacterized protein n=1 Tax=Pleurodeles waltl TaxID=8319 RepID=A0AAV7TDK7_PLEWA|nr:hypothetical protein NDU88_006432 [Pleurodeles waltl]
MKRVASHHSGWGLPSGDPEDDCSAAGAAAHAARPHCLRHAWDQPSPQKGRPDPPHQRGKERHSSGSGEAAPAIRGPAAPASASPSISSTVKVMGRVFMDGLQAWGDERTVLSEVIFGFHQSLGTVEQPLSLYLLTDNMVFPSEEIAEFSKDDILQQFKKPINIGVPIHQNALDVVHEWRDPDKINVPRFMSKLYLL